MTPQEKILAALAGIFVLGVGSQWLAASLRIPAILFLLTTGIMAGPIFGLINPDALFGDLMLPVVSLSVAAVLFEGSMSLRLQDLRQIGRPLFMLLTVGVLITWVLSTAGAIWVLNFPLSTSLLLGAILTVTGPTVIGPLLRDIRPIGRSGPIARWEGIVVDPIGAVLAVLVFGTQDALRNAQYESAATTAIEGFATTMLVGLVIGALAATILLQLLMRHLITDHLQSPFALMLVMASFAISNLIRHESGLVTVTVMGILLANQKRVSVRHILEFKESLSVLLISSLFILLSARLNVDSFLALGGRGVVFVVLLIVVIRPVCVFISTAGSELTMAEKLLLSWLAPRGIVAAAVASVFALQLAETGQPAEEFATAVFMVIVGTVVVYGLTAGIVARRLGLSVANPQGVLIASAHPAARAIAMALLREKIRVRLVDTNAQNLQAARMEGLPTYHADILSDAFNDELDLGGLGRFFGLTSNDEVNSLAARRFGEVFGRAETYRFSSSSEGHDRRQKSTEVLAGRVLFGNFATFQYLDDRCEKGAVVKRTRLTNEFDFKAFRALNGESAVVLFVIDETGRLSVATADRELTAKPGQIVIALVDKQHAGSAERGSDQGSGTSRSSHFR